MWCWMAMRASNETVKCENLLNCRFVRPMPVQSARLGIPSPLDLLGVIAWDTPPGRVQLAPNNMRCDHPVDFAPRPRENPEGGATRETTAAFPPKFQIQRFVAAGQLLGGSARVPFETGAECSDVPQIHSPLRAIHAARAADCAAARGGATAVQADALLLTRPSVSARFVLMASPLGFPFKLSKAATSTSNRPPRLCQ